MAARLGEIPFVEISCRTGENVELAIQYLVEDILNKKEYERYCRLSNIGWPKVLPESEVGQTGFVVTILMI